MKCPRCRSERLSVDKTVTVGETRVRERHCRDCGLEFPTREKIQEAWIRDFAHKSGGVANGTA